MAVDGIDLDVRVGADDGADGPIGCGKSTLLRLLVGLVTADAARCASTARRSPAHGIEALRRRIGYVIQDGGLFPHLTAARQRRADGPPPAAGTPARVAARACASWPS